MSRELSYRKSDAVQTLISHRTLRGPAILLGCMILSMVNLTAARAEVLSSLYTYSTYDSNSDDQGDGIARSSDGTYTTRMSVGAPQSGAYWGQEHRGHISFSLPGLTGAEIHSAYLRVPYSWYRFLAGSGQVDLYFFEDNGQRDVSDFQRLDYTLKDSLVPNTQSFVDAIEQDVKAAMQQAVDEGWAYLGFTLENASFPNSQNEDLGCGWYGSNVTLEYSVPEPSAFVMLLGAGLFIPHSWRRTGRVSRSGETPGQ